jgi:hypothetical protein
MNNALRDYKIVIGALCASFERQLSVYTELRDAARSSLSKLVLSRGDAGVLVAGVEKKARLLEQIDKERAGIAEQIEYWQENRQNLAHDRDAASLNEILARTETVIKEFLAEEEKLRQYVEKIFKHAEPKE